MQGLFPKSFARKTNPGKGNKSRITGQILVLMIFLSGCGQPPETTSVHAHSKSPIWIVTSAFSTGGDADALHFPGLASGELDVAT